MNNISIEQCVEQTQVDQEIVCILCDGTHGNNSNCQRND